ncbi:MAG: sigma-70 family RNA polymerase sigma factor [Planctomycetota bacterium]
MSDKFANLQPLRPGSASFVTTRWSVVVAASQDNSEESDQALETLCTAYWVPVYAYVCRVTNGEEARDLTQGFFAHLLEKKAIGKASPDRGRFRAFLLTALKNFLANERDKQKALKRGGGRILSLDFELADWQSRLEPSSELTPEKLFERRWVMTLINLVLETLKDELATAGKERHFEALKQSLTGEMSNAEFELAAEALQITPAAVRQAGYRLRNRYRELFRQEVARTIDDVTPVDEEIHRLLDAFND